MKYIKENYKFNIKISNIILLILLGITLSATINAIMLYTGYISLKVVEIHETKAVIITAFIIKILASCLIGPILEELLFRGILFKFLSEKMSKRLSIILTTLIFAVVHTNLNNITFALFAGIIFIYFYMKTKNLLTSTIIHSACNITSLFIMFIPINLISVILLSILLVILIILNDKYIK